jgi:hypothetical protein
MFLFKISSEEICLPGFSVFRLFGLHTKKPIACAIGFFVHEGDIACAARPQPGRRPTEGGWPAPDISRTRRKRFHSQEKSLFAVTVL